MNDMKIIGFGHYVPKTIKYNDDFKTIVETSDEWIKSRTGISKRHLTDDENTSDIASKAALMAMEDAGVSADDIDLVVCATITPDSFTPSTASKILKLLGIKRAMAFDISAACSGFIYAMNTASAILTANNLRRAIVIGAETLSKIVDYSDRSTCVLFGDGAGAVVIEATKNKSVFYCMSKTDEENILYANALKPQGVFKGGLIDDYHLKMNGQKVFKFAIEAVNDAINSALNIAGLTIDDIDLIIPHQANERIIAAVCRHWNLDFNRFYLNISEYGNTSAASIAIALSEAHHKKVIGKGNRVMLVGFGAGLTWASMIIEL